MNKVAMGAALLASLLWGPEPNAEPPEPSAAGLRALVEAYAHAIEANNVDLALSYVHPQSPSRHAIEAALGDQLASHFERSRTSTLDDVLKEDGTVSVEVGQEVVRVFGLKLSRSTRRSTFRFRELGGAWWIWEIDLPGPGQIL